MKTHIYATAAKASGIHGPYLIARPDLSSLPDHPAGGEWTYWKDATMAQGIIGCDPEKAKAAIEAAGFYIVL